MSARTTYTKIQGKYVQKSYTTASLAATDAPPEVRELQYPLQYTSYNQKSTVDLGLPKIPGFTTCKIPYQSHTALGNSESFTLDYN